MPYIRKDSAVKAIVRQAAQRIQTAVFAAALCSLPRRVVRMMERKPFAKSLENTAAPIVITAKKRNMFTA